MTKDAIKLILTILAGIAVCVIIAIGVDRLFFAPGRADDKAQTAKVETGAAKVQTEIAKDAIDVGEAQRERVRIIERITHENTTRIMAAAGADNPIAPDVDRAFMDALCLRRTATRSDPACAGLPRADRADAGPADAISDDSVYPH